MEQRIKVGVSSGNALYIILKSLYLILYMLKFSRVFVLSYLI